MKPTTQNDTLTRLHDDWEVVSASSQTPLNKAETLVVLSEVFTDVPSPTQAMRDAVAHYRQAVISKDAAYKKQ